MDETCNRDWVHLVTKTTAKFSAIESAKITNRNQSRSPIPPTPPHQKKQPKMNAWQKRTPGYTRGGIRCLGEARIPC